jgi:hypothetical protein
MKMASSLAVLFGLLIAQCAQAENRDIHRPYWVIIATLIDRATGKQLSQSILGGPELEFDEPGACKETIDQVRWVPDEQVTVILTCAEVVPDGQAIRLQGSQDGSLTRTTTLPTWFPESRYLSAATISRISNMRSIAGRMQSASIVPFIRSNISTEP